jgi:HAD superfamily hydrolase (TIGR01509 family)
MRTPFVELIIFDCDGVLADSERITNTVFAELLREQGLNFTLEEMFEHFVGNSASQCLAKIHAMLGRPVPDDFMDHYRARCKVALEKDLKAVAGVEEMLPKIKQPFCVASNSDTQKLKTILGYANLLPIFEDRMFSVDQVAQGKPAPDIFLFAAKHFGADPARSLVIEDTPIGVCAGVAAGMTVLGYAELMNAERLLAAGAFLTFSNMAELPDLIARFEIQEGAF